MYVHVYIRVGGLVAPSVSTSLWISACSFVLLWGMRVCLRTNLSADRNDPYRLHLVVRHVISILPALGGLDDDERTSTAPPVRLKSATLPASLDVKLAKSYVMLAMSGVFDGQEVSARDMRRSALAREFCRFTREVSGLLLFPICSKI